MNTIVWFALLMTLPNCLALYPIRNPDQSVNVNSLADHVEDIEKLLASLMGRDNSNATKQIEDKLASLKMITSSTTSELKALRAQLTTGDADLAKAKTELADLKAQVTSKDTDLAAELNDLKTKVRSLEKSNVTSELQALRASTESNAIDLVAKLNALKSEVRSNATTEMNTLKNEIVTELALLNALKDELISVKMETAAATSELQTLKQQFLTSMATSTLNHLNGSVENLETTVTGLQSRIDTNAKDLKDTKNVLIQEIGNAIGMKTEIYAELNNTCSSCQQCSATQSQLWSSIHNMEARLNHTDLTATKTQVGLSPLTLEKKIADLNSTLASTKAGLETSIHNIETRLPLTDFMVNKLAQELNKTNERVDSTANALTSHKDKWAKGMEALKMEQNKTDAILSGMQQNIQLLNATQREEKKIVSWVNMTTDALKAVKHDIQHMQQKQHAVMPISTKSITTSTITTARTTSSVATTKTTTTTKPTTTKEPIGNVRFSAYLDGDYNFVGDKHHQLQFRNVQVNKGYGYDPSTGLFTAPVTGLYHFSANIYFHQHHVHDHPFIDILLMHNGNSLTAREYFEFNPYNGNFHGNTTAKIHLNQGDRVFVEIGTNHEKSGIYMFHTSDFEGHLLQHN